MPRPHSLPLAAAAITCRPPLTCLPSPVRLYSLACHRSVVAAHLSAAARPSLLTCLSPPLMLLACLSLLTYSPACHCCSPAYCRPTAAAHLPATARPSLLTCLLPALTLHACLPLLTCSPACSPACMLGAFVAPKLQMLGSPLGVGCLL